MIPALRELYGTIASRLLDGRLLTKRTSTTARYSVRIRDAMADHIARSAAKSNQAEGAAAADEGTVPAPPATDRFTSPQERKMDPDRTKPGLFSALSERFARHRSQAKLEPFMREKMRANTLKHVNKALALARQGQAEGAKIHAELAETAMKTAGEYMSDDEYGQFQEEVEARLRSTSEAP